jgi:hypothetical protein
VSPKAAELARRLAAHKQFRWMPRMLAIRVKAPRFISEGADPERMVGRSFTVLDVNETTVHCNGDSFALGSDAYAPDIDDSAVIGTIEGQVREVCPTLLLFPPENPGQDWAIGRDVLTCLCYAKTRGEVWALAFLEVCK